MKIILLCYFRNTLDLSVGVKHYLNRIKWTIRSKQRRILDHIED